MTRGNVFVVAALAAALLAGPARADDDASYIRECVDAAVEQAKAAGNYSGYGCATNSYSLLGGWLSTSETLQYQMNVSGGKSYLFVGAGDRDIKDLDLSVTDGSNTVEDTETDNTPWVHIEAEGDATITITMTNYQGSGAPDFCCFVILEEGGAPGSGKALSTAAGQLAMVVAEVQKQTGVATDKTPGLCCLLGGLFGTGGELTINRNFGEGSYALVGWGDGNCQDIDLKVAENGSTVAEDTEDDTTPVVPFTVSGDTRLALTTTMFKAKGNSFGLVAILKQ